MAVTTDGATTRRGLLVGVAGALAAWTASALGRPLTAAAASGDNLEIGAANTAGGSTILKSATTTFIGQTTAASGQKAGVLGTAPPGDGRGVMGKGPVGVLGQTGSPQGFGVYGNANGANAFGVFGRNAATTGNAIGVKGSSPMTGVYGEGTGIIGVGVEGHGPVGIHGVGEDQVGIGVSGFVDGTNAVAIVGRANAGGGIGVQGSAAGPTGIGGSFEAEGNAPGTFGLRVIGRAAFSTAGSSNVAAGVDHKNVTPGVELTGNTSVLATLNADGGVAVKWVEIDTGANTFTIHFTGATTSACSVAWFVLG